jgi:hypothetical protein
MGLSINFDHQACVAAEKVGNVWAAWVLTAELQSIGTPAQPMPDDDLRKMHLSAHSTSFWRSACLRLWSNVPEHV